MATTETGVNACHPPGPTDDPNARYLRPSTTSDTPARRFTGSKHSPSDRRQYSCSSFLRTAKLTLALDISPPDISPLDIPSPIPPALLHGGCFCTECRQYAVTVYTYFKKIHFTFRLLHFLIVVSVLVLFRLVNNDNNNNKQVRVAP